MVDLDSLSATAASFTLPNVSPSSDVRFEIPSICCAAISGSSGRLLAAGTTDRVCYVWKLASDRLPSKTTFITETPQPSLTLKQHDTPVVHVKFNLLESFLATGCRNGTVTVCDVETGQILRTFTEHSGAVSSIDFMPVRTESCMLVSASADRSVKLWDMRYKRACVRTFRGHTDAVLDVKVSPHGRWIATAGREGIVLLWGVDDGRLLTTFSHQSHNHHDHQPFAENKFVDQQPRNVVPPGKGGPFSTSVRFHPQELLMASLSVSSTALASSTANGAASVKFWDLDHFECLSTYLLYSDRISKNNASSDTEEFMQTNVADLQQLSKISQKSQTLGNRSVDASINSCMVPQTSYGTLQLQRKRHSTGTVITKRTSSNRYSMEFAQSGTSLLITDAGGCISSVLWEDKRQTTERDYAQPYGSRNPAMLYGRRQMQNWIETNSSFEMVAPISSPNHLIYACVSNDYRSIKTFPVEISKLCPPVNLRRQKIDKIDTENYSRSQITVKLASDSSFVVDAQFPSACSLSTSDDSGIQSLPSSDDVKLCRRNPSKREKLSDATLTPVPNEAAKYTDVSPATTVRRIIPPAVRTSPPTNADFVRSLTFDCDERGSNVTVSGCGNAAVVAEAVRIKNDMFVPARHTAARNLRRISSLQQLEPISHSNVPLLPNTECFVSSRQHRKKMSEGSDVTVRRLVPAGPVAQRSRTIQSNGCRRQTVTTVFRPETILDTSSTAANDAGRVAESHPSAASLGKSRASSPAASAASTVTLKPRRAVVVVNKSPSRHQPSPELMSSPSTLKKQNNKSSYSKCFAHLGGGRVKHSSIADSDSESERDNNGIGRCDVVVARQAAARIAMPPPPPPQPQPVASPRSRRKTAMPPISSAVVAVPPTTVLDTTRQPTKSNKSPSETATAAVTKRQQLPATCELANQPQKRESVSTALTPAIPNDTAAVAGSSRTLPMQPKKYSRGSNPFVSPPTLTVAAPNPFLSASSMLMLTPPLPNTAAVLLNNSANSCGFAATISTEQDAAKSGEYCAAKQIIRSSPTALYVLGERASNMHQMLQALQSRPNSNNRQPVCDVAAAVTVALRLQDPIALVDFLDILADGGGTSQDEKDEEIHANAGTVWNLTICTALLPEIYTLMQHEVQSFVLTACRAVRDMLKRFGPTLREMMRAPAPTGVDLTREARLEQCRQCVRHFNRIQMYLTSRFSGRTNNNAGTGDDGRSSNKSRRVRRECEQTILMLREFLV